MGKNFYLYFLSVIAFLTFSCRKPDITPAYLIFCSEDFIDTVCVDVSNFNKVHDTNYDADELEVLRQHNIKDIYVSINGHGTGYWQLPCTIPVRGDYSGENNIRIIPCVRVAANTLTTVQYLFLEPAEKNIFLKKEEKRRVSSFKFDYRKEVLMSFFETFSQSSSFSSLDTINGAEMKLENGIGKISINNQRPYFDIATQYFDLSGHSLQHFWEIYYMSNEGEMTAYLNFQNTVTGAIIQDMVVFPSSRGAWKKAYIDLTDIIYQACGTASRVSVRLCIRGLRNANSDEADFSFGNMRVITF
jgi:hypothetical protein